MADDQTPSDGLTGSLFDRIKGFFTSMWTAFWETSPDVLNPFFSARRQYSSPENLAIKSVEYLTESLGKIN